MKESKMSPVIHKNTMILLLLAHVSVLLPHLTNLPMWINAWSVFCLVWRVLILKNAKLAPGKLLRIAFVLSGFLAIYHEYRSVIGPLAGVGLLILAYSFKLLETKNQRDTYLVIFLGYFVIATAFLFDQGLSKAIYLLFSSLLITGALFSINQPSWSIYSVYKKVSRLFLQSAPLMVVLFILIPRIDPLWSISLGNNQGRTGLSNEMNPGDISKLIRSDTLVFRVKFTGDIPPPSARYWRTLVLDQFDGRRWTYSGLAESPSQSTVWLMSYRLLYDKLLQKKSEGLFSGQYIYEVVMEASEQRWLSALSWAMPLSEGVRMDSDFRLSADKSLGQSFSYRVESFSLKDEKLLAEWVRNDSELQRNVALPAEGNEQAKHWARSLRSQSPSEDVFIQKLLQHFRQQDFYYSLEPPLLGKNAIDDFFFVTRKGFCEHYASAFTFMARSVGIPARVIMGYQGGEQSAFDDYLRIYQFDAHAWTEVWLADRGWVRVDPTAAVAPSRVEHGLEEALQLDQVHATGDAAPWLRYRYSSLSRYFRQGSDYIQMRWIRDVMGYNNRAQVEFMRDWFGAYDLQTVMVLLVSAVSLCMALVWVSLFFRGQRKLSPEQQIYKRFCQRLAWVGLEKAAGEGEQDFALRVARQRPELAEAVHNFTERYIRLLYSPNSLDADKRNKALVELNTALKKLPLPVRWRILKG